MTTHAEGTLSQRVVTLPALHIDADRVAHVMEIGRAKLVENVLVFKGAAVEAGDRFDGFERKGFEGLAETFQTYVDEADRIIGLCRGLTFSSARLAFVTSADLLDEVREALDEMEADQD